MDDELTFGQWLRRQRKAHDLTQAELAGKVDCAVGTIRKLEADELRPSKEIAARLAAQLGVPEADRAAFVAFARGLAPGEWPHSGAPSTASGGPGKAPPRGRADATLPSEPGAARDVAPRVAGLPILLTPFIGREHEVAVVRQELLRPSFAC